MIHKIDFTAEEITDLIWAVRMFAEFKEPAAMVERMRVLEVKLIEFDKSFKRDLEEF